MVSREETHLVDQPAVLTNTDSPKRTVRIITLRHAETVHNAASLKLREKGMTWQSIRNELVKETEAQRLVDAELNAQGIEQAKATGVSFAKLYPNLKYIFTSPLRRTVTTSVNIAESFFSITKHRPDIILSPWAMKIFSELQDLAIYSYEHLAKYPFIDRSALSANPRFWFLDYMFENPVTNIKKELVFACQQPDFLQRIADITIKCVSTGVEKPSQAKKRIDKLKEQLKNFISDKEKAGIKVQDDEILVVSHGHLLAYMLGLVEVLPSDIFVLESKAWQNTQIHPYDLEM